MILLNRNLMITEELHYVVNRRNSLTAGEMQREMTNIPANIRNQVVVRAVEFPASADRFPEKSQIIRNEFAFQTGHDPSENPTNAGVGCVGIEIRSDDAHDAHALDLINDFNAINAAVHNMDYPIKVYNNGAAGRLLNAGWLWDDRTSIAFVVKSEHDINIPAEHQRLLTDQVFAHIRHHDNPFEDFKTRLITSIIETITSNRNIPAGPLDDKFSLAFGLLTEHEQQEVKHAIEQQVQNITLTRDNLNKLVITAAHNEQRPAQQQAAQLPPPNEPDDDDDDIEDNDEDNEPEQPAVNQQNNEEPDDDDDIEDVEFTMQTPRHTDDNEDNTNTENHEEHVDRNDEPEDVEFTMSNQNTRQTDTQTTNQQPEHPATQNQPPTEQAQPAQPPSINGMTIIGEIPSTQVRAWRNGNHETALVFYGGTLDEFRRELSHYPQAAVSALTQKHVQFVHVDWGNPDARREGIAMFTTDSNSMYSIRRMTSDGGLHVSVLNVSTDGATVRLPICCLCSNADCQVWSSSDISTAESSVRCAATRTRWNCSGQMKTADRFGLQLQLILL